MSTEHSFPVVLEMSTEQLLAVVRFAYSQVVRNGWSKQDCTSYLTLIGFSRFACDTVYNYIVECVAFDMIAWNADRPERSEFLRSYSRVEDNSVWIYPFLRSYSRVEDNSVWITGYYSRIPPRNYSRQYRNEAMHNTYLGHLRYFWEGPCESNIPNRLRLGMIERSISSDDGGVDDASDEGYTDGLYPDFPKRWRKKEELAFEGGVQGGFVHEDNIKQKDRPTDVLAITSTGTDDHSDVMGKLRSEIKQLEEPRKRYCGIVSYSERSLASGEEDRPNLLMYENRLNENRLFEILNELFTSFGYASPSPNEPWVYNEDSDDDSLPDLSDSFEILNGNDRLLSYASPNPNEAPVYNEDDSNGDSDDDSLPELS